MADDGAENTEKHSTSTVTGTKRNASTLEESEIVVASWGTRRDEWLRIQGKGSKHTHTCKVCNVVCNGVKHYESHLAGKKHRHKERELGLGPKVPPPPRHFKKFKSGLPPHREYELRLVTCSNTKDCFGSFEIYDEMVAAEISPSIGMYHQWIALCCDKATAKYDDIAQRTAILSRGLAICLELRNTYSDKLSDASFALIIRLYSISGQTDVAKEFLSTAQSAKSKTKNKTRLYGPIFKHHPCETLEHLAEIMKLFSEGVSLGLDFEESQFVDVLMACKSIRTQLVGGNGAEEDRKIGVKKVVECAQQVLHEMRNVIFTITSGSASALVSWYNGGGTTAVTPELISIDDSGRCPACQCLLKSIELTTEQRATILRQVDEVLASGKGEKGNSKVDGAAKFEEFKQYLQHEAGAADVIIDGANVGFYMQRPDRNPSTSLNFSQIDRVVRHFKEQNKRILLVLHERHFHWKRLKDRPKWTRYIKRWDDAKILYRTPTHMNDDWFWLYACLYSSSNGKRPIVVTNDLMRDHHFKMLSRRYFLQWRERHVVNFVFPSRADTAAPIFIFPQSYSSRIQSHDATEEGAPIRWHFPVQQDMVSAAQGAATESEGVMPSARSLDISWLCVSDAILSP